MIEKWYSRRVGDSLAVIRLLTPENACDCHELMAIEKSLTPEVQALNERVLEVINGEIT